MPVTGLHLVATERLLKQINVDNKDDFRLGSIFPDALWTVEDISKTLMSDSNVHNKMHMGVKESSGWKQSNCYKFYAIYAVKLEDSDFLKGYMFHLFLDNANNRVWDSITEELGNDRYMIKYKKYSHIVDSIDKLCEYKYSDAWRFALEHQIIIPNINNISLRTSRQCEELFGVEKAGIEKTVKITEELIEFKRSIIPNFVLDNALYNSIIETAIDRYLEISNMERW